MSHYLSEGIHTRFDADGTQFWYKDGRCHREDGPAIISRDTRFWVYRSLNHRVDGPAIEYVNGLKEWYIEGIKYTEEQFLKIIDEVKNMTLAERLTDPRWWVREWKESN
jgi:hypothetical protein